jgi:DNA-binding IscR family transcriptional regulator
VGVAQPSNTRFGLAVHLLVLLGGEPDRRQSSEVLAEAAGTSPVHVRRVLGELRRAGLVVSRNGVGGGWQVAEPVCDLRLDAVWTVLQGDDPVLGLRDVNPDCPVGRRVHGLLEDIDRRAAAVLGAELAQTTLGDLVRDAHAGIPLQERDPAIIGV